MSQRITYETKFALQNNESIPERNKVTDDNMNEIKNVTNNHATDIEMLNKKYEDQIAELANQNPQLPEIVAARQGYDTLAEPIKQKIYYFNSVNQMKTDTKLQEGDTCQTVGYYTANDGGAELYKIVNDDSLIDDGGSIHALENGLKAKLVVKNDELNFDSIGAKELNENALFNNSVILQKAINICYANNISTIKFGNKKYYFSSSFSIDNENLKINLIGDKKTTFVLQSSTGNLEEFNVLSIHAVDYFGMESITFETYNNEELDWSQRRNRFFEKTSRGNANLIKVKNCNFNYLQYGIRLAQSDIITTPVSSQAYTKTLLIEDCIFNKVRDCAHICNAETIIMKDSKFSGLNEEDHQETGSTNRSVIFYIRPNIRNLILNNLIIEECTGDVLHFNQFNYGVSEPTPEDYPDYYVDNVFINNIKMKDIGRFIGLNSYTKNITANNIQIDTQVGGEINSIVYSLEGKFEKIFINNFCFKDIYSLINITENSRGGDIVSFTNGVVENGNKRYQPSVGHLKELILDNIQFKRIKQSITNQAALLLALNGNYDTVYLNNITCDIDYTGINTRSDLFRFGSSFKGNVIVNNINYLDLEKATKTYDMMLFYFNANIADADIFVILNNINAIGTKIFSDTSTTPSYNNVHLSNCYIDKIAYNP